MKMVVGVVMLLFVLGALPATFLAISDEVKSDPKLKTIRRISIIYSVVFYMFFISPWVLPFVGRSPQDAWHNIRYPKSSVAEIQQYADSQLHLFDNMPQVPVYLRDEPMNEENPSAGYYDPNNDYIVIKRVAYNQVRGGRFREIILHELTHAWVRRQGLDDGLHGPVFRKKLLEVY
jgi:hypothetical protein